MASARREDTLSVNALGDATVPGSPAGKQNCGKRSSRLFHQGTRALGRRFPGQAGFLDAGAAHLRRGKAVSIPG
jgi:hypothetical protein